MISMRGIFIPFDDGFKSGLKAGSGFQSVVVYEACMTLPRGFIQFCACFSAF